MKLMKQQQKDKAHQLLRKDFKLLSKFEKQRFQEVLKWLKALYKTGTPLDLFSPLGIFYTFLTMQQKRREKNELIKPKTAK